jgi:hypothetical protein
MLVRAKAAQEVIRADNLLADVRSAEDRSERLYGAAEVILERALEAADLETALNAIRAAVDVMGEARQYMELRGELTGELHDSNAGGLGHQSRGSYPLRPPDRQHSPDH